MIWFYLVSSAGPFFFFATQLCLLISAVDIAKNKNERNLSAIPFIALFTCSFVWFIYGVSKGDELSVVISNTSGIIVGLISIVLYQLNSYISVSMYSYATSTAIISLAAVFSILHVRMALSIICMLLSVALTASPFATVKLVLLERSTESMPIGASISQWFSSLSWALYGKLVVNDVTIYAPAALGLLLASAQILLAVWVMSAAVTEDRAKNIILWREMDLLSPLPTSSPDLRLSKSKYNFSTSPASSTTLTSNTLTDDESYELFAFNRNHDINDGYATC